MYLIFIALTDFPVSFVFEVDFGWTNSLQFLPKNLPLSTTEAKIENKMLAEFQYSVQEKHGQQRVSMELLLQTMNQENFHTVPYFNLKL